LYKVFKYYWSVGVNTIADFGLRIADWEIIRALYIYQSEIRIPHFEIFFTPVIKIRQPLLEL
jgi:hypothetical protein